MRLKTTRSFRVLGFIYIISLICVILDVVILNIDGTFNSVIGLSLVPIAISLFLIFLGHPKMEYDSDGEVLNITTEDPNFKWMGGKLWHTHVEFPKRKLANFKMTQRLLKRQLIIQIKSKEGHLKKRVFSISFLSRKQRRELKYSLNKVMSRNAKNYESRNKRRKSPAQ